MSEEERGQDSFAPAEDTAGTGTGEAAGTDTADAAGIGADTAQAQNKISFIKKRNVDSNFLNI